MLIALGLCGLMYCGNGGDVNKDGEITDSTGVQIIDTGNASQHVDPSIAYPQPPITGSNQDSSRVRDTPNRPGY